MMCHTVHLHDDSFDLPGHKADRFFEGNQVIIQRTTTNDDPLSAFINYLYSRDHLFPFSPELWLRSDGSIPTRGWFLRRLHKHFPTDVGGHSMRAGGATTLAEAGLPPHIIQAIGHRSIPNLHSQTSRITSRPPLWLPKQPQLVIARSPSLRSHLCICISFPHVFFISPFSSLYLYLVSLHPYCTCIFKAHHQYVCISLLSSP